MGVNLALPGTRSPRIRSTAHDVRVFSEMQQQHRFVFEAEQFAGDAYLDEIIQKPWGWEYRVFADNLYDVWKLHLLAGKRTSLHCHPRKETALLCLRGTGKVQFLNATYIVRAMDVVHIGKGVFHSTSNIGSDELELIEVETPRNKLDLVRVADTYGRSGARYERQLLEMDSPQFQTTEIANSKLRRHCVRHHYRFGLASGRELAFQSKAFPFFLVSLSVMDAIEHRIQVFNQNQAQDMMLDPETLYLTVGHTS